MFHKNNNISYEVPFKINHKNPCLSFLKISAGKTPPPPVTSGLYFGWLLNSVLDAKLVI